jgi:hypothetical protein
MQWRALMLLGSWCGICGIKHSLHGIAQHSRQEALSRQSDEAHPVQDTKHLLSYMRPRSQY